MRRLPFVLPHFLRVSWVSDNAKATWTPRFNAIVSAWRSIEWQSAQRGLRRCALTRVDIDAQRDFEESCISFGMCTRMVTAFGRTAEMVVARGRDLESFERAWALRDHDCIGMLLGYPTCCRAAFVGWHAEGYEVDPTWPLYAGAEHESHLRAVVVEPTAVGPANMLVRWLGIMPIPHIPCAPGCTASAQNATRWSQLGEELGFANELKWASEILSWPAEWSALHGIAEVKLPVLKFTMPTEATATKYVIQWKGTVTPDDAAQGLQFPFRPNPRRAVTRTASFKRGSLHIRESEGSPPRSEP